MSPGFFLPGFHRTLKGATRSVRGQPFGIRDTERSRGFCGGGCVEGVLCAGRFGKDVEYHHTHRDQTCSGEGGGTRLETETQRWRIYFARRQ